MDLPILTHFRQSVVKGLLLLPVLARFTPGQLVEKLQGIHALGQVLVLYPCHGGQQRHQLPAAQLNQAAEFHTRVVQRPQLLHHHQGLQGLGQRIEGGIRHHQLMHPIIGRLQLLLQPHLEHTGQQQGALLRVQLLFQLLLHQPHGGLLYGGPVDGYIDERRVHLRIPLVPPDLPHEILVLFQLKVWPLHLSGKRGIQKQHTVEEHALPPMLFV